MHIRVFVSNFTSVSLLRENIATRENRRKASSFFYVIAREKSFTFEGKKRSLARLNLCEERRKYLNLFFRSHSMESPSIKI